LLRTLIIDGSNQMSNWYFRRRLPAAFGQDVTSGRSSWRLALARADRHRAHAGRSSTSTFAESRHAGSFP